MPLVLVLATALQAASLPPPTPPTLSSEPNSEYIRFETVETRVRVEPDGTQEATMALRALLRTSAAIEEFGQIGLPYVDGFGTVSFDDVVVQKPDGRRIELKDLKPEDINPFGSSGLPIPADVRFRKITIPGLEPGDRLSYRATLRQRPLAPGRLFGETKFTPLVSDPLQVYELDLPRGTAITVRLREGLGAQWQDVPAPPDRLVRRLSVRVPRPEQRPEGPTEAELRAWSTPDVIFTNFGSWEDVGTWWWSLSKERLVPDPAVKAEAARIVGDRKSARERLEVIHAFVASRVRYLSVAFGVGRMQPRAAGEVLSSRYGDCKDKHALLAALASSAGIDVRPVLIHTVRKDLVDEAPMPQQFDHMISVARLGADPSQWLWLDSTNSLGLPGYLTPNLRDKRALLIDSDGKGRVMRTPADPPFTPRTEVEAKGSLDASGVLRTHMSWRFRSDDEVRLRFFFGTIPKDRYDEVVKAALAKPWEDAKVTNVAISDPSDLAVPFRVDFDVEKTVPDRSTEKDWDLWVPLPDFELPQPKKQAAGDDKLAEFSVREFSVRAEITLPDGARARAPLSVSIERPFGQFRSAYSVSGPSLKIERTLQLGRSFIMPADLGGYESFLKAVESDRKQDFLVGPLAVGAPSAVALHAEGKAALDAKNYDRAVELLHKAVGIDPKIKGGWGDLGRALRRKGDTAAAIKAYEKQIEIDPFDEYAYSERAYVLIEQGRWEEAEKDLLKQIEVAPFKAWSYKRLGDRRWQQARYREAAEYYARAATIEPKNEDGWISLGWAQALDGRKDEAISALDRARSLGLNDWQQVNVARALQTIGEDGAAAKLAETALTSIADRLSKLAPQSFDEQSRFWTIRLAEAWQVIGAASLAAGDLGKAERYLRASWRVGFLPEAAWSLGLLRERQGKADESARWLLAAESLQGNPSRLPAGHEARLDAARKKASPAAATELVMGARTVKLSDAPVVDLTEEVLVLVDGTGSVESLTAVGVKAKDKDAFQKQVARMPRLKLDVTAPDDKAVKLVLRGVLSCFRPTNCSVVLDLPGMEPMKNQQ
jgi:tetratricopeptide (TPR) repeat protein